MLVSGFVSGKLIYIPEFPFNCPLKRELKNNYSFLPETHPEDMHHEFHKNYNYAKAVFVESLEDYKDYLQNSITF